MTKNQELKVLDRTIDELGSDSYLGPWLASIRAELALNIQSDFFPEITLASAGEKARDIIARAEEEAKIIHARAEKKYQDTSDRCGVLRDELAACINRAAHALEQF